MKEESQESPAVSVVLPVFNEEGNLPRLTGELASVFKKLNLAYEVLIVDDCSNDQSLETARGLKKKDSRIRIVKHGVNAGQSAALVSGIGRCRAPLVITMDADCQNDPSDIPLLLEALEEGVDAVCGIRQKRQDNWVKRLSSRIGNKFRDVVTGDSVTDSGCAFRLMRREVLGELPVFNGLHRFLPTFLRWQGCRVVEVNVNHRPRISGVTNYGIANRAWRGMIDCFVMRWWHRRCVPLRRWVGEE